MPHVPPTRVLGGRAAFAFVDDVSIAVTNVTEWTDESITAYLEEITALGNRVPARCAVTHFVGAMPSARHRKLILDWLEAQRIATDQRTCVLTDSAVMRGAMTAYGWMTRSDGAAFEPKDRARACAWAARGMHATAPAVQDALERCYRAIGLVPP